MELNDNVSGLIYSDKAVFTLPETPRAEFQACRFMLTSTCVKRCDIKKNRKN
jgi:hypothetical protein